jgi:signal transduction histidine kinase
MKTLLVLASHPALADQIRAALNPDDYRVLHRFGPDDAAPLLTHALVDVCVADVESTNIEGFWLVEKLRRLLPQCPLLLFTGAAPWEWEEESYLRGVERILRKPVLGRALTSILDRLGPRPSTGGPTAPFPVPAQMPPRSETARVLTPDAEGIQTASQSLKVLRNFSAILTHSLCAEEMLRQFLLRLREIIGVNRAAIFLRQPGGANRTSGRADSSQLRLDFIQQPSLPDNSGGRSGGHQFRLGCALGLTSGLLEHFELSFQTGIGGHLFRQGRILRRRSPEALVDAEAQKEFEILGAQVAIPILDGESLVGIAVFDGRVTGEPLSNNELELVFHLLEQLGLAVKNIWLHGQLAANHNVLSDILRELNSACVVVSRELAVLHLNKAARKLFARTARPGADLEFTDLPQSLGAKIYQVLKTGSPAGAFKYSPEESPESVFNVTIVPLHSENSVLPTSALLTAEDLTQSEKLKRLEIETAGLRLLTDMARKVADEIGNAMAPITTCYQLSKEKRRDQDFLALFDEQLASGLPRIERRVRQMQYLASDGLPKSETFTLESVLEKSFGEARIYEKVEAAQWKAGNKGQPINLTGERKALSAAFFEIFLNAIQARPSDPRVEVRIEPFPGANNATGVRVEIEDTGAGFSPEALGKAGTAFWTRRTVGMGLGLAVARKNIEMHGGKLETLPPEPGRGGVVRLWLPATIPETRNA